MILQKKNIALNGSDVWHEYQRHGDAKIETDRGQIAFTRQQFIDAIKCIYSPDVVECLFRDAKNPKQRQSFAYAKETTDGHYVIVEAIGGKTNPNIVPVEIIYVKKDKWNRWIGQGKTIGEMLFENDLKMLSALDSDFNKKNRVIAAQFASDEAIANTPHSPRSKTMVTQPKTEVNPESTKILSDRDPTAAATARELEKQNAKLKQDVADLREPVRLQGKVTNGTEFRKSSIDAAVKGLAQTAGATLDAEGKAQLHDMLRDFYKYIASDDSLAWENVREEAGKIADFLQSNVKIKPEMTDYARDVLREIRGYSVIVLKNNHKIPGQLRD